MIDTWDNLYAMFLSRVRDNLHTCLYFARRRHFRHARETSRAHQRVHHRLVPAVAAGGAHRGVHQVHRDFAMACSDEDKFKLQEHMGHVRIAVTKACREYSKFRRNVYVTPKSYLSFIEGYKDLYTRKLSDVKVLAEKINSGLSKLFEAKNDVKTMQVDLAEEQGPGQGAGGRRRAP